ncbi:hypothetical protein TUM4438_46700 [Shewanella sairae]|uniref:Uncharacterized protein n=1 Tax=Shewanella sairae TaxID=190310 RepID=A0ABQ4NST1_9GAMM|nr:hypothetical protein TUM4438_46700 [Shewanella sairae]
MTSWRISENEGLGGIDTREDKQRLTHTYERKQAMKCFVAGV